MDEGLGHFKFCMRRYLRRKREEEEQAEQDAKAKAAWADWRRLLLIARGKGYDYLARGLQPPSGAGWRQVDQAARELEEGMSELDALLQF